MLKALYSKIKSKLKLYLYNDAVAVDELANATTGGAPSETISGRAYVAAQEGDEWGKVTEKVLDHIQKDHCEEAHENDMKGRHEQVL